MEIQRNVRRKYWKYNQIREPFCSRFCWLLCTARLNFNWHCLINNNISIPKKVISVYIPDIPNQWPRDLNTDFSLGNYLFGSVRLTKNADLDQYKYSSYDIEFDSCLEFSFTDGSKGKSVYIADKNKDILTLGEGPTQRLDDAILTAEAKYPIDFTQARDWFVLSLHYDGSNNFLFVNATKMHQFKARDSEKKLYTVFR